MAKPIYKALFPKRFLGG